MARRGRKKMTEAQKLAAALERTQPNDRILELRRIFSFVRPPADKRQDGRNGEIDSEICDPIGQMTALGLFDGHGHDPIEMRDKGRFWGGHYARLFKGSAMKTQNYERADRSRSTGALTAADLLFDKMDEALSDTWERGVLLNLIVDPLLGDRKVFWAQSLIDEALIARGRMPQDRVMMFPGMHERELLKASIRGLCALIDGALPARFERAA
jgi:hypothetical protein